MKKMVLIKTNNNRVNFLNMKTFQYSLPVIGQPFYAKELNGSKILKTSNVIDIKQNLNLLGIGTIIITTKNSEYVFKSFGY